MNRIHKSTVVSDFADIETSQKGNFLTIGKGGLVDSFVKIKFAGGVGNIKIGDNTYVNSGTVIYSGNGVNIGNNVLIAANCSIAPVNHSYLDKSTPIVEQGFLESRGGILIGNDVWIGCNAIILDGAIIGNGAVIGAGSLVRSVIPEFSVVIGSPAKIVGYRQ